MEKRQIVQSEQALHRQVAQYLDLALVPPAFWSTFPAGGGGKRRGAILRGLGLKPGMPDIWIFDRGATYGGELKIKGGQLSAEQRHCHELLRRAGIVTEVWRSLDDVIAFLDRKGVPHR